MSLDINFDSNLLQIVGNIEFPEAADSENYDTDLWHISLGCDGCG